MAVVQDRTGVGARVVVDLQQHFAVYGTADFAVGLEHLQFVPFIDREGSRSTAEADAIRKGIRTMSDTATHPRFVLHDQLRPQWGIPWSNAHILRLEKKNKFPRRIRIGNNTIAWLDSDLAAYVSMCAAEGRAS